ncbi:MAG: hypothetical protein H6912_06740 [Kordiimonadaceae bacterium]|nr:hypothetical protein [Kordiimonadaceae bacterium]
MTFKWESDSGFRIYDPERGLEAKSGSGNRHISSFVFYEIGSEDHILGKFQYCESGRALTDKEKLVCPPEVSWIFIVDFRGFYNVYGGENYIEGYSNEKSMTIAKEVLLEYAKFRARRTPKIIRFKMTSMGLNEEWLGKQ